MKSCKFQPSSMSTEPCPHRKARKKEVSNLWLFFSFFLSFLFFYYFFFLHITLGWLLVSLSNNSSTPILSHRFFNVKLCIMHTTYLILTLQPFPRCIFGHASHHTAASILFPYKPLISLVFWLHPGKKKYSLCYDSANSPTLSNHILFLIKTN